jgi:1,4-dihydroxy-2-naphthoyl-CoA synthase
LSHLGLKISLAREAKQQVARMSVAICGCLTVGPRMSLRSSGLRLLAMTEDAKEGLKAFGEKRKPSWTGK